MKILKVDSSIKLGPVWPGRGGDDEEIFNKYKGNIVINTDTGMAIYCFSETHFSTQITYQEVIKPLFSNIEKLINGESCNLKVILVEDMFPDIHDSSRWNKILVDNEYGEGIFIDDKGEEVESVIDQAFVESILDLTGGEMEEEDE